MLEKIKKNKTIIFLGALIFIIGLPYLIDIVIFGNSVESNINNSDWASFLGSYLGSFLGGIITIFAVLYTTHIEKKERELEKIETRFFNLLNHYDNIVSELNITFENKNVASGKKVFCEYLKEINIIIEYLADLREFGEIETSQKYKIAYAILLFGTGINSSRQLKNELKRFMKDENNIDKIIDFFELKNKNDRRQEITTKKFYQLLKNNIQKMSQEEIKQKKIKSLLENIKYNPFNGHQSTLGHYYRFLYQIVNYIENLKIEEKEKYQKIKFLRSKMSTHEQALLSINAMSNIGEKWFIRDIDSKTKVNFSVKQLNINLIEKYDLIKNIPEDFFDKTTELDLEEIFEDVNFEYKKIVNKN